MPFSAFTKLIEQGILSEVCQRSTYRAYRQTAQGVKQEVLIEVLDAGPEAHRNRFQVTVYANKGKATTGYTGPTLKDALMRVQWSDLD